MREILKGGEPTSLTQHRAATSPDPDYESYRDKGTLRTYLAREQRGLCCYCLSRIRAEPGAMKIEHWHCQANHSDEQLDYSNLLGACLGNEGRAGRDQHCDARKGDRDFSRNPANPLHRVEALIQFSGDGRIRSTDPVLDSELDQVLNLNHPFLTRNRKNTLAAFQQGLAKRGPLQRATLERWLRKWNGEEDNGDLQPFCQVVVFWLRKRLNRP
jgi:uncharacterized protein (TIGR02646 family)